MLNQQQITREIQSLSSLRNIIETYQEIAATRMQRVKDSVLRSRDFSDDLREIYQELRLSYLDELDTLIKRRKSISSKNKLNTSLLNRNNKSVSVLLSSNTKLYGDIIKRTFEEFQKNIEGQTADIVIVGKVGLQLYKEAKIDKPYTFFELSDTLQDIESFKQVIETIKNYERIKIFHGKFEDILSQLPATTEISSNREVIVSGSQNKVEGEKKDIQKRHYIFEPSLEEILFFFETEILASILEQTISESNLSKFTSRMISLDATVENINKNLKEANFNKQWLRHNELNKKQLDALAGLSLWHQ